MNEATLPFSNHRLLPYSPSQRAGLAGSLYVWSRMSQRTSVCCMWQPRLPEGSWKYASDAVRVSEPCPAAGEAVVTGDCAGSDVLAAGGPAAASAPVFLSSVPSPHAAVDTATASTIDSSATARAAPDRPPRPRNAVI